MSIPDPSWKVRTRACPFYAKGRCIFADACNFLHDAPSEAGSRSGVSLAHQYYPETPQGPHIAIDAGSPRSVKSPPRSPRMQGLLYALRDVIGEDEEEDFEEESDDEDILATTETTPVAASRGPSAVNAATRGEDEAKPISLGTIGATLSQFRSAINTELLQRFAGRTRTDENAAPPADNLVTSQDDSLDTIYTLADTSSEEEESSNASSSSGDTSHGLSTPDASLPLQSHTPIISPMPSLASLDSPSDPSIFASNIPLPSSPAPNAPQTMLSPVTLSSTTFALLSFADSVGSAHLRREGSIDSGYSERWPSRGSQFILPMSPPRSPALSSTFDLLTSPFGNASTRFLCMPTSPTFGPIIRDVDVPPLHTPQEPSSQLVDSRDTPLHSMPSEPGLQGLGIEVPTEEDEEVLSGSVMSPKTEGPTEADDEVLSASVMSLRTEVPPSPKVSGDVAEEPTTRLAYDDQPNEDSDEDDRRTFGSLASSRRVSLRLAPMLSPPGAASRRFEAAMQATLIGSPVTDPDPTLVADAFVLAPPVQMFGIVGDEHQDVDEDEDVDVDDDDAPPPSYLASISQDDTFTFSEDGDVPDSDTRVHLPLPPAPDGDTGDSDDDDSDGGDSDGSDSDSQRPFTPPETAQLAHGLYSSPNIHPANVPLPATPMSSRATERPLSFLTPPSAASAGPSTPLSRPFGRRVFTPPSKQSTPRRDTVRPQFESPTIVLRGRTSRSSSRPVPSDRESVLAPLAPRLGSPFREHPPTPASAGPSLSPARTDEDTRTIPFGFRNSFALGRASNSSLIQSRQARRETLAVHDSPASSTGPITPLDITAEEAASSQQATSSTSGLRPLRLSRILTPSPSSSIFPSSSKLDMIPDNLLSPSSSVSSSSNRSLSNRAPPFHAPASSVPSHVRNHSALSYTSQAEGPPASLSAPTSPNLSWHNPRDSSRSSFLRRSSTDPNEQSAPQATSPTTRTARPSISTLPSSPVSEPLSRTPSEPASPSSVLAVPLSATSSRSSVSTSRSPLRISTAPPTPRPDLLFAIAADDPEAVRKVLADGTADVNASVGPQSALSFAMTNKSLKKRVEIVRALLAFGANRKKDKPEGEQILASESVSQVDSESQTANKTAESSEVKLPEPSEVKQDERATAMEEMDPVTRYYVSKAEDPQVQWTTALMERSTFQALTQVRYDLIGQDRALEQLFRVLSMHSQQKHVAPIVVMLCGPSGYGKTLVARRFGSLLNVPTHTVNMINVRSSHDLWQAYSTSPDEEPSTLTLAEFLLKSEGKRCVVVLDEIEKIEDEKTLWSLHQPWEMGRCQLESGKPFADVRNVIWIGTSNIGDQLVLDNHDERADPAASMTREEYVRLMGKLRGRVSERLGAPLLSRVTTVLPFVPFTEEEKTAIAAEALFALGGDIAQGLSSAEVVDLATQALTGYLPTEGARSLYRAMSALLMDLI